MAVKASLVSEFDASTMLGIKVETLRKWRWKKCGPPYLKLGRCVRYSIAALEEFAGCELTAPTSAPRSNGAVEVEPVGSETAGAAS